MLNTVVGDGAKALSTTDLWCALAVACVYALLYLFVLDRYVCDLMSMHMSAHVYAHLLCYAYMDGCMDA